jgi:hypothetical protein
MMYGPPRHLGWLQWATARGLDIRGTNVLVRQAAEAFFLLWRGDAPAGIRLCVKCASPPDRQRCMARVARHDLLLLALFSAVLWPWRIAAMIRGCGVHRFSMALEEMWLVPPKSLCAGAGMGAPMRNCPDI